MSVSDRLSVLEEAGVITPMGRSKALELTRAVETEWQTTLTDDDWGMAATHVATAVTRAERGDEDVALEPEVRAEAERRPLELELARRLLAPVEDSIGRALGEAEVYLVALHLAAVNDGRPR